jgi:hypothetical protein
MTTASLVPALLLLQTCHPSPLRLHPHRLPLRPAPFSAQVVPIAIKAAFLNCGQNCASGERFIVHRKIYDKFTQQVSSETTHMHGHHAVCKARCCQCPFPLDTPCT